MKPGETELLSKKQYTNLESLLEVFEDFVSQSNQHPSMLAVEVIGGSDFDTEKGNTAQLEAECLSDGSIVYNVYIR